MLSSGTWRRVGLVKTDVSEERVASIFRAEENASKEVSVSNRLTLSRSRFLLP
jgi:hypothetical protein